jgi:hypothetical protein
MKGGHEIRLTPVQQAAFLPNAEGRSSHLG